MSIGLERAKKAGRKYLAPVETQVGGFSTVLKVLPDFLFNRKDRSPKVAPGPFRTDAAVYTTAPEMGLRVTWFGHSSTLLEIDGTNLLVDPVWDQRASPFSFLGPKRFFAPTLPLAELPKVEAVLISHDHYDHLGKQTVRRLVKTMPHVRWVTSLGVGAELRKFGVAAEKITELDWTESTVIAGLTITSLPARHFSGRSVTNRNETLWACFVLQGERHKVFYGADSGMWEGFQTISREYGPFDLTMIEVGAFHEAWKDIHLGPDGGVEAFEILGGGILMPIHWGLFDLALHGWREPIERVLALADARGYKVFSPQPGRPEEVRELRSDWWR